MTRQDKVKNIVAFMMLMVKDEAVNSIMSKSPDYILEKFQRYVESYRDEYEWGLHPSLKRVFDMYCEKWEEQLKEINNERNQA